MSGTFLGFPLGLRVDPRFNLATQLGGGWHGQVCLAMGKHYTNITLNMIQGPVAAPYQSRARK